MEQKIQIEREVYEQKDVRDKFGYSDQKEPNKLCNKITNISVKKCAKKMLPILDWLPKYKWKKDLTSDVISGITVAIMHIPQGIAYAMLGNVPPVIGIYMAFFPVLVYFFLGTSKHNSMGTFAVVCLMTGKVVSEYSHPSFFSDVTTNHTNFENGSKFYSPTEVATAVTFCVGIIQLLLYFFQLGSISVLLSDSLVSGFTTGAAIQVLTSQIPDLLGITIKKPVGYFVVVKTYMQIVENFSTINWTAITISSITIFILVFNNEIIKPAFEKSSSVPIPIELFSVVIGTTFSYYMDLKDTYGIKIVGHIPKGLPEMKPPPFELINSIYLDGFIIAIVSFTITYSMALLFAQKLNYKVDPNQELLAQGAGNLVGAHFSCMPFTASLSRSTVQETVGGKTQIASVVSSCLLLVVLLYIGPLFEPLPKSVLAAIIVVALKGMLKQVTHFFNFFKLNKVDGFIWLFTFLTIIFVSIDMGLLIGVVMSLLAILLKEFKPHTCLLGRVPNTDLYLNIDKYKEAKELEQIKIFHYRGALNFAMRNTFTDKLLNALDLDLEKELEYRVKLEKISEKIPCEDEKDFKKRLYKIEKIMSKMNVKIKALILDFSSLSYIDSSGVFSLKSTIKKMNRMEILVCLAGVSDPSYERMLKCGLSGPEEKYLYFPTVHDAVLNATSRLKNV